MSAIIKNKRQDLIKKSGMKRRENKQVCDGRTVFTWTAFCGGTVGRKNEK